MCMPRKWTFIFCASILNALTWLANRAHSIDTTFNTRRIRPRLKVLIAEISFDGYVIALWNIAKRVSSATTKTSPTSKKKKVSFLRSSCFTSQIVIFSARRQNPRSNECKSMKIIALTPAHQASVCLQRFHQLAFIMQYDPEAIVDCHGKRRIFLFARSRPSRRRNWDPFSFVVEWSDAQHWKMIFNRKENER